jgi:hypothetical protein
MYHHHLQKPWAEPISLLLSLPKSIVIHHHHHANNNSNKKRYATCAANSCAYYTSYILVEMWFL